MNQMKRIFLSLLKNLGEKLHNTQQKQAVCIITISYELKAANNVKRYSPKNIKNEMSSKIYAQKPNNAD